MRVARSSLCAPGVWLAPLAAAALVLSLSTERSYAQSGDDCYRKCVEGEPPRVCRYEFVVEIYNAMNSACGNCSEGVRADCFAPQCIFLDGIERTVYSINRRLPGPGIYACVNDTIEVTLVVKLPGKAETLHWHGLEQKRTPYFDGVDMVTQCPVTTGQRFLYRFLAERHGLFFYHSHSGLNKVMGVIGVMAFYLPVSLDPHASRYDTHLREHIFFVNDWSHYHAEDIFPGRRSPPQGQEPQTLLINGMGNALQANGSYTKTPLAEFRVQSGLRHRFGFVNAGSFSCPMKMHVQNHSFTLLAVDASDVEPVVINLIGSGSGERYDFVIHANQEPGVYWVHVWSECLGGTVAEQVALLRYDGVDDDTIPALPRPTYDNPLMRTGVELNTQQPCGSKNYMCVAELESVDEAHPALLREQPDQRIVVGVSFYSYDNKTQLFGTGEYHSFMVEAGTSYVSGMINNISYTTASSALITNLPDVSTCNSSHLPEGCTSDKRCECTHVMKLELNSIVEIVIVDTSDNSGLHHPMHWHGYSAVVVEEGIRNDIPSGPERLKAVVEHAENGITPKAKPPKKDTIVLANQGYVILRLNASNPGVWFFHCHFQYHMATGMEAVLQVGEFSDFVKAPLNFPTCGSYIT